MPKIAVFSSDLSYSVRKGIVELDRRLQGATWLIVRHAPRRTLRSLVRGQWMNWRRNGWRWFSYQIAGAFGRAIRKFKSADSEARGSMGPEYSLDAILARQNVKYLETPDIHGPMTLQHVREFAPDLGLSLAAPILKESLFSIPRLGTLNLHKGRLPDYRGMPPAFWELWNDESTVGCSVHRVTSGLDKGEVVAESEIPRQRYSTVKGLQLLLDEEGVRLMCDAVDATLAGTAIQRPQAAGGKTYRKPTLKQVGELQRRLLQQDPRQGTFAYRTAKGAYLRARLHARVPSMRPTVAVILYHRVSDELRDSLTIGIEQFDQQMALIREHCHPLSIHEVLNGEFPRRSSKPFVCVTFDDGYKDNYTTAAPLLLRHQIPAAFFVSTGLIGTSREFEHDRGKTPAKLQNMSWDDLREMTNAGFVIGSHTVNHIDCAKEPIETVERELRASLETLRSELKMDEVILAYPFGGRQHMTPERLQLVKRVGYVGCLSAYGGFNRGAIDRYNVLRCGVNWGFSDVAFRCRIAGIL